MYDSADEYTTGSSSVEENSDSDVEYVKLTRDTIRKIPHSHWSCNGAYPEAGAKAGNYRRNTSDNTM